jgi:hypothetical protein
VNGSIDATFVLRSNTCAVYSEESLTLIHIIPQIRQRYFCAHVTVVNGIKRKATYKEIRNVSNYVANSTPTSPPVLDLQYFDRLIFVTQSEHSYQCDSVAVGGQTDSKFGHVYSSRPTYAV